MPHFCMLVYREMLWYEFESIILQVRKSSFIFLLESEVQTQTGPSRKKFNCKCNLLHRFK